MKECKRLMQYIGLNPTDREVKEFMKACDKNGNIVFILNTC